MITHEQIRRFHALYRQDRNAQALTAAMAGTGDHSPAKERPLLALCRDEHPAGGSDQEDRPQRI